MPNFSAQCVKGVQGMGYLCAFILSLAICVPMSMHQDQFKGRCLLFSTGHWQEQVKAQSCRDSNQILWQTVTKLTNTSNYAIYVLLQGK